jgi:O-antigen ligase
MSRVYVLSRIPIGMMNRLVQFWNLNTNALLNQDFRWPNMPSALKNDHFRLGLILLVGFGVGLAVIISTYYLDNIKLLIGLIGGITFVLITMRWPEFGILCFVALLSGLISLTWLPILHLGPISLNISDMILLLLLGLVFLRTTTQSTYKFFGSPLLLPLFLFIGAFLLSAVNAILIQGINFNEVLRTVRVLILWLAFIPTLQLVRDEPALRRLLIGLLILTGILLIGVAFPNKFEPLLYIEERGAATGAQTYSDFTRVYFAGDMVLYAMIPVTLASIALIKKGNQFWRIGLLCFLLFWAFRTFFRQYWLTLFVVCALLFLFLATHERIRLLKRLAPVIAIGVLLLIMLVAVQPARIERLNYVITDRLGSLLQDPLSRESSLQWRVIETRYALDQLSRHPIFGIGLANQYRPPMENEADTMYSGWAANYVENGYLYIGVMMGVVGLLPFLLLCAAYLFRVFRHQHEIRDEGLRAIYLGFGLAFLGMMACNLASPTFVNGTRLVFFPVAMALSEIILRLEREKRVRQ